MEKNTGNTKKVVIINLLLMLAVVVALPFLVLSWLDSYTLHGQAIVVPDVNGMLLDEAAEALRKEKLDFEIVDYKYVKGAKENQVLETRPTAGSKVKEGRKIELTMSSEHEPMQVIPDIIDNCSLREAVARLRAAGFNLTSHVEVPGEKDWVYSLMLGKDTLSNGMQIPVGSTVTLLIGSGEDEQPDTTPIIDNSWFE
ncbi:MAG: PASTA domain-containing protein [Bacteroidaceae bacterium]|nr:PASTA domain-containing protein [Bacteroidaceae bacterium]